MGDNKKHLYESIYPFSGENNDELCFKKGDIIIVAQKIDGGWWEGMLDGNSGWFPSNYVKEHKSQDESDWPNKLAPQIEQQREYRSTIIKGIIDSERKHVTELQNTKHKHINNIEKSGLLTLKDFKQLIGNFDEILIAHKNLLAQLEEQFENQDDEQLIGGIFLKIAPTLQRLHSEYISNHPKAVCLLEKYRNELSALMEQHGSTSPGILTITTALSQPFRRLERYPTLLQEYQRHLEDAHPDRGNTQRSAVVFKELNTLCNSIRRQKHLEIEVLTNKIRGLDEGQTLNIFGEIIHMRSVALLPDNRDRYLVLFQKWLIILYLSPRASSFIFEGKYSLSGLTVTLLEDNTSFKNAFELSGQRIDSLTAICQTKSDQQQWVDMISKQIAASSVTAYEVNSTQAHVPKANVWRLSCLRPSPPLGPTQIFKDERKQKQSKKKEENWHEEDTLILRVIEAYCSSNKNRYTINSINLDCSANYTKENTHKKDSYISNDSLQESKVLVDTVNTLKNDTAGLLLNYWELKKEFEREKRSSQNLLGIVKNYVLKGREDIPWDY